MNGHGKLTIVGCGPGGQDDLTLRAIRAVKEAELLVGPSYLLELFPDFSGERREMDGGAGEIIRAIDREIDEISVVLLVSGDPGVVSPASGIVKSLADRAIDVVPGISSVQAACAALGRAWDDLRIVRLATIDAKNTAKEVADALAPLPCAVLTDPQRPPEWVAGKLRDSDLSNAVFTVCSNLRKPDEKIVRTTCREAAAMTFSPLSVVLIELGRV